MRNRKKFSRREISVQAALLMLGGATISIMGCGGGSAGGDPTPSPTPTPTPSPTPGPGRDVSGVISDNHSHTAVITAAQLTAGAGLSLSIQGTAAHNHVVDLTSDEIVLIRNGNKLAKTSTLAFGHVHDVTFN